MRYARNGLLLPMCVLLPLFGCSDTALYRAHPHPPRVEVDLEASTGLAIDRLLGSVNPPVSKSTVILVTSFVDLNDMSQSTKLGRLIAEQTAEHLIQRGFRVPEARLTKALHVREEGEFMLSRDVGELRTDLRAGLFVTGTTSTIGGVTYVNFRLIRRSDGVALAAAGLQLPEGLVSQ